MAPATESQKYKKQLLHPGQQQWTDHNLPHSTLMGSQRHSFQPPLGKEGPIKHVFGFLGQAQPHSCWDWNIGGPLLFLLNLASISHVFLATHCFGTYAHNSCTYMDTYMYSQCLPHMCSLYGHFYTWRFAAPGTLKSTQRYIACNCISGDVH